MTFYWWSHWFWITSLSNILLLITFVHTYPSQEISLEFNQNSRTMKTAVTKLFQTTTTTLAWATTAPAGGNNAFGIKAERTVLQSVTPDMVRHGENDELPTDEFDENPYDETDDVDDQGETDEYQLKSGIEQADSDASEEFKRSAETYNKTNEEAEGSGAPSIAEGKQVEEKDKRITDVTAAGEMEPMKSKREEVEMNNYTNFSSAADAISTNVSSTTSSANVTSASAVPSSVAVTQPNPLASSASASASAPASAAAPAAPKITGAQAALDWFNALATVTSTSTSTASSRNSGNGGGGGGGAGIAPAEIAAPQQAQRVPFTLENANKEDELRRAESEHRSRKSKVLSAEYKHINRFINLSTDSKNLLTRSASSAPEYDAEEGNISSEALAIQRTYFLDAGAISAICFTIFGVCCAVGTVGIVLYRRRYLNKPQALSEPDSSVYIDDSTMRDNSDEMYSLDNDSFLNSLEAMTIQNYWTDTVKHTKL